MDKYKNLGIIKNESIYDEDKLNNFEKIIHQLKSDKNWNKQSIVDEFFKMIPEFKYFDNGKYLNEKM